MDETSRSIIEKITVRYNTPTRIKSGDICTVFYDCVRLSPADLARLAAEATGDLPEDTFDVAVGIAYSGILFASAVAGGREVAILRHDDTLEGAPLTGKKVVLCDDVVHSGRRLVGAAQILEKAGATVIGFAVIVDRSDGNLVSGKISDKNLWAAYTTRME